MESVYRQLLLIAIFTVLFQIVKSQKFQPTIKSKFEINSSILSGEDIVPIAQNDTLTFCANCGNLSASINLMKNDAKGQDNGYIVYIKNCPNVGLWELKSNGDFKFTNTNNFLGKVVFTYKICKPGNSELEDEAQIIVTVLYDTDCDGVADEVDIDDDNDGILDNDDGIFTDTDNDSIPNYLDIDSDNDGIPDIVESRPENYQIPPSHTDSDGDGWDDIFDPDNNGRYFPLPDTDKDGTPDFLDLNSDNDEFSDFNEGYDANFDTIPDINCSYIDSDKDGLDESFDTVDGWLINTNSCGHNAPLPDYNNDGIRDWRDAINKKPIPGRDIHHEDLNSLVTIFPNPATSYFTLSLPNEVLKENINVNIYDFAGVKIAESKNIRSNSEIKIENLISGVYLVQIVTDSYRFSNRLVVAR
jgi:hypothetical protein